jgi:hypothetical protein
MVLFRLRTNDGTLIPLYVVESLGFGGQQSVIIYEAPGSDGGTVVTTGRMNKTVTLSGRLIGSDIFDLNNKKVEIERIRDLGEPVNLDCPLDSEDTGRYIIETFEGNLPLGQERYITFTLTLKEYRQANIQAAAISLVNYQPAELLKQRAADRNLLAA